MCVREEKRREGETNSTGFALLCVVEATGPINGNVTFASIKLDGATDAAPCAELAELEKTWEYGAVFTDVEARHLLCACCRRVWRYRPQEVDVLVAVKLGHLQRRRSPWPLCPKGGWEIACVEFFLKFRTKFSSCRRGRVTRAVRT